MPTPGPKLPPQNLEAEVGVLGSLILDNDAYTTLPALEPEDFYRDPHQTLFRRTRAMLDAGLPVDALTLCDELERHGELDRVGGQVFIAEVVNATPHSANAAYYADIVKQKSVSRDLIDAAEGVLREGYSGRFTAEQLVESAEKKFFAIGARAAKNDSVREIGADVQPLIDRITGRVSGVTGLPTTWADFNSITNGLQDENMVIVAARPSMGKSAFAINILEACCVIKGKPGLLVSLENGYGEIRDRFVALRARVDGTKLVETARLTPPEMDRLAVAIDELQYVPMDVDDSPARTMAQVAANARRAALKRGGLGVVVIDYIQLLSGNGGDSNRQEQVSAASRDCKLLARELKCPVVVLSQLNRKVEDREDRTPRMADLRESGALEQDADVVVLLHRPDYYKPDDEPGRARLIVAKNRNGRTGVVTLDYDKPTYRFSDPVAGGAFVPPPADPPAF